MSELKKYDWKDVDSKYSIEYDPAKPYDMKVSRLGEDVSNKQAPVASNFAADLFRELLAANQKIIDLKTILNTVYGTAAGKVHISPADFEKFKDL